MNLDDFLARRMEAHRAACADLESDPLIQAAFNRPTPIPPMETPTREGALFRRQGA